MSTLRAKPGGWIEERKPGLCRWCGVEVPKGRFTFCGDACVHEWKLRTDPGYLRDQVFARDRGVCAVCGIDTVVLRRDKRKLDYAARKLFEKEWGARKHLWDADHVVPVAEGGGECDLSNMRTLCIKCHREATAALRQRLKEKRSKTSGGTPDAALIAGGDMPGKKAHKSRNVANAGMRGVHQQTAQGRKSLGETRGEFARNAQGRRGQYSSAGTPPLTKK